MNHHLESLGWTLLHFCWQATAIALVYGLADVVLAKTRSQSRYVLALGTMLLMLITATTTFAYEEMQGGSGLSSSPGAFSSHAALMTLESSLSTDLAPSPGLIGSAVTQPAEMSLSRLLPWLDVAWLLGVVCLSTRTIGGWRLIQRLRRSSLVAAPEAVSANFFRLCQRLGITRQVSLCISQHIQGPLAIGIVRSLVILPASALMVLSPEQLEAVLAHELAHVRRADYLWNLVQTMIETLLFFHPAVWWLGSRLRQQRELCCDDVAVQSCADPLVYATALLSLEERRRQQLNLAMALDGNRPWSGLRVRIARILGEASGEKGPHDLVPIPLAAMCAVFLLVVLSVPQLFAGLRETTQTQTEAPAASAAPTPAPAPDPPPALSRVVDDSPTQSPAPVAAPAAALPDAGIDRVATATTNTTTATTTTSEDAHGAGHGAGAGAGSGSGPDGSGSSDGTGGQTPAADASAHKGDYIDGMRAAGYDVDVDKYIAMKVQGITPEYAQAMAKVGFGKPSADDLIAMKVQGITPEYVSQLRAAGLEPSKISDLIAYRIFKVTPEFVAGMKAAGFDAIPPGKLVALRVHNVTPEYARTVKQQYPGATVDELVKLRVFHIDDAFLAAAKRHGFTSLSIEQLVRLRISGVLGDTDAEAK